MAGKGPSAGTASTLLATALAARSRVAEAPRLPTVCRGTSRTFGNPSWDIVCCDLRPTPCTRGKKAATSNKAAELVANSCSWPPSTGSRVAVRTTGRVPPVQVARDRLQASLGPPCAGTCLRSCSVVVSPWPCTIFCRYCRRRRRRSALMLTNRGRQLHARLAGGQARGLRVVAFSTRRVVGAAVPQVTALLPCRQHRGRCRWEVPGAWSGVLPPAVAVTTWASAAQLRMPLYRWPMTTPLGRPAGYGAPSPWLGPCRGSAATHSSC
mmetsp:Transcript_51003/g.128727  ORF Transcript_51003/g.128727 Transcript_51003/m.128727 type:complete len:267 (-) Transcript_51003:2085-2885(-)